MSFSSQNLRELNPWADPWWNHIVSAAADETDRLNAENARLREALKKIATIQGGGDCCSVYEWFVYAKRIARAALAEKEEK